MKGFERVERGFLRLESCKLPLSRDLEPLLTVSGPGVSTETPAVRGVELTETSVVLLLRGREGFVIVNPDII